MSKTLAKSWLEITEKDQDPDRCEAEDWEDNSDMVGPATVWGVRKLDESLTPQPPDEKQQQNKIYLLYIYIYIHSYYILIKSLF